MDPLESFAEPTRAWFAAAFGAPTPVQSAAWPLIHSGRNVLAVAPTGSGKTLAAFLSALDSCLTPAPLPGVRVLYVSPLKALAVDVERNLRAPLAGISAECLRRGLPEPHVRVALRTGDTPAAERQSMVRRPPDILITTPESLFLLLTSQARATLTGVGTVIVDEVHALAGSKRGAHLAVSLARLDHLAGRRIPRVGLSATVRPPQEAARFLGGDQPVEIVVSGTPKEWDLRIEVPVEDMADLAGPAPAGEPGADRSGSQSIWPHVENRIVDLVEQHRSTIVFANSRRLAERLTSRLNEIHADRELDRGLEPPAAPTRSPAQVMAQAGAAHGIPPTLARAHHGSVSKEQRALIEDDLKSGRLRAVVATSSLELGIDMGAVDLVVQVEAPPSVSSGLQRVGRAGHQVGAVSEGVVLPKYRADLLASAVVVERMRAGELEQLRVPRNPLDVAAQQVVAAVAMEDWQAGDLLALLRTTAAFRSLSDAVFESVVEMLAGRYPSDAFAELRPRIVWDRQDDLLTARPGAQRLAVTSGGTIPDRGLFAVHLEGGGRVGELDEEMVYESRVGDAVSLGASTWQIIDITHDRVIVVPAPGAPGRLPFWRGDALGRSAELGRAIGEATRALDLLPRHEALAELESRGLDRLAARNLVAYVEEQAASGSAVPTDRTVVVERTRDELGDWRLAILSPYGARVHAPWALLVRERLTERFSVDAAVLHGDDGIVARLPDLPGEDWVPDALDCLFPDPDEVEPGVTRLIGSSALFASRFRECASRALLLPRPSPGRRAPLWQQRQRSAQLLQIAAEHPTFPIVLEAVRECLQDVFDLPALVQVLASVRDRRIRVAEAHPTTPSPFARSLLFGYVAEYLYEGDTPLAERRAAALTLDPALLGELLGQSDLRDLLEPEAIEQVVAQLQHLDPERRARDAEEAADLLRVLGPLSAADAADRGVRPEWLDALHDQRRVFRTRVAGAEVWSVVEDAPRLRDGLGAPLPPGLPEAHLRAVADPVGDLVARYARTHGPFRSQAAADALGLPAAVVDERCRALGATGRLVEGRFLNDVQGTQWCQADVLRMIKRRSVALLRHQIEPVSQPALAAFLPAWHGIGGPPPRDVPAALLEAITTIAGVPVAASALEASILPLRVPGITPASLDELTSSGEVQWTGAGSLSGGDGWVVLTVPGLGPPLPRTERDALSGQARAILDLLEPGGGWFLTDLVTRVPGESPALDVPAALLELMWSGWISNDTLEPVRLGLDRRRARSPAGGQRRSARAPRGRYAELWRSRAGSAGAGRRPGEGVLPGRWFALAQSGADPTTAAVARAEAHLGRLGLVTRGAVAAAGDPGGFAAAYRTLVALEDRGRVQRVYAVEGLGAAQFALPGVVDRLRQAEQGLAREHEALVLATTDPANAYGAALEWPATTMTTDDGSSQHRPARSAGSHVVLQAGRPVLFLERGGRSLLTFREHDAEEQWRGTLVTAALALLSAVREGRVARCLVQRVDGCPAMEAPHQIQPVLDALVTAGFTLTPRGYRAR